ncbi:serine/threonine-protein kinase [Microcoleus sp. FACHB-672]|uniref:serine/threonine-protein kinase n=1 Tax=Microcoleus sp. FACHB-672 TaxID=2692825 RepID=UPI001688C057|nr:serine/threonine-protein kinase [Microcoleus sp. FACHB-672]MBD2039315.1 protein kinase [Microcoleus sp. FACHB-672]
MKPVYCNQGHENPSGSNFCLQCGEKLQAPATSGVVQGMILGERYRISRQIGQGGFGRTYLSEDVNRFNEQCVLKEFAPQVQGTYALQKGQELFEREAGVLYKLQHPQIPRFREMFRANLDGEGHLFLVQDYVDGQTYRSLLVNRRVHNRLFSEAEITQMLLQILPVLDYIHTQGVVHRDISPDNLMLRNSDLLPVLIDFGGVKQVAATVASEFVGGSNAPATRLGKVGYAPDEQMQMGAVYPHSDLYALAVTVLVLLTGKEPQELRDPQTLSWKWRNYVSLSPSLGAVFDKMLAYRPGERYQSAKEALQALTGTPPAPLPPPQPAPLPPPPQPNITQATQAVSPVRSAQAPQPVQPPQPVPAVVTPQRKAAAPFWLNLLLMGIVIAGMGVVGWWAGNYWVDKQRQGDHSIPPPDRSDNYSAEERQRKDALRDRRKALGIDYNFYIDLVNEAFYTKYPEQQGRVLSDESVDEAWRARWDSLADQQLNQLAALSDQSRRRLGSYTPADIDRWKTQINLRHLSSRALNDLTDAKFFYLFPEQPKGQNLLDNPVGQVWQAIATDFVQGVGDGTALEEIKFDRGSTSTQLAGNLEPGAGKAYIAKLSKDQVMKLTLDAPPQSTRLSLYTPSGKNPPLLEDSKQVTWSNKLSEAGYYEIVVVSEATEPISYNLTLQIN